MTVMKTGKLQTFRIKLNPLTCTLGMVGLVMIQGCQLGLIDEDSLKKKQEVANRDDVSEDTKNNAVVMSLVADLEASLLAQGLSPDEAKAIASGAEGQQSSMGLALREASGGSLEQMIPALV